VRIRLIRKLAKEINGVNLSGHDVDDVFELPQREATLLIAEGWAVETAPREMRELRRAEDWIRDEHHDASARTITPSTKP